MNEDYVLVGPDAVSLSAGINCSCGSDVFGGCMGDYFFSGRVGLHAPVAIAVDNFSEMLSDFVVVASGCEVESANQSPNFSILILKVDSMTDMR